MSAETTEMDSTEISEVIFYLRDINPAMTKAWKEEFAPYSSTVKVYKDVDCSTHDLGPPMGVPCMFPCPNNISRVFPFSPKLLFFFFDFVPMFPALFSFHSLVPSNFMSTFLCFLNPLREP